jgi:hypothetical protein
MFITNRLTPAEMLSELLGIKGYTKADTERFRESSVTTATYAPNFVSA